MRISTKGRYALRMLLDLAEHQDDGFVALKDIAERQMISKQYLEQIVTLLNSSGILRANRGKKGGYMLSLAPSDCTVGQVLRLTEGTLMPVACLEDEPIRCDRSGTCKTLPMWIGLKNVIANYLDSVSLQDMIEQYRDQSSDNYFKI